MQCCVLGFLWLAVARLNPGPCSPAADGPSEGYMVGISPQLQDPLSCAVNHALFSVSFGPAEGESTTRLADAASASSQSETGTGTADPGDGFTVVRRKRRAPDRQASGKRLRLFLMFLTVKTRRLCHLHPPKRYQKLPPIVKYIE